MMDFQLVSKEALFNSGIECFEFRHSSGMTLIFVNDSHSAETFVNLTVGTPALNHKGTSHIIEHCIASESSGRTRALQQFASTYQDKTSYEYILESNDLESIPFILNSIFRPAFKKDKQIFLREGWRLEERNGQPSVGGIVLNEVTDLLASPMYQLINLAPHTLYNGSIYGNISGGLPEEILNLTYEETLSYHDEYYVADRCCMFVYGAVPLDSVLQLVHRFFSSLPEPQREATLLTDVYGTIPYYESCYPAVHEQVAGYHFISVNYAIPKPQTQYEYNVYYWLERHLSKKAESCLQDQGMGKIFRAVYKNSLYKPYLTLISGFGNSDTAAFSSFASNSLASLVEELPRKKMPNFVTARIERSRGWPSRLQLGQYIMEAFFSDLPAFAYVQESPDHAKRNFIDRLKVQFQTPHCAIVMLKPARGCGRSEQQLLKQAYQNATVNEYITDTSAAMITRESIEMPPFRTKRSFAGPLKEFVSESGLPECEMKIISGVHYYCYQSTGTALNVHLYFDISDFSARGLGVANILAKYLNLCLGRQGLSDVIRVGCTSIYEETDFGGNSFLVIRLFADTESLSGLLAKLYELLQLRDLYADRFLIQRELSAWKASMDLTMMTDLRSLVLLRALSYTSLCSCHKDAVRGITFYRNLADLVQPMDVDGLIESLTDIAEAVFAHNKLMISVYTHDKRCALIHIQKFVDSLHSRKALGCNINLCNQHEGFIYAKRTNCISLSIDLKGESPRSSPKHKVLCEMINRNYLYPVLRNKYNVYASEMSVIEHHLVFLSMKDPNMLTTLEVFYNTGKYLRSNFDQIRRNFVNYAETYWSRPRSLQMTPANDQATLKRLYSRKSNLALEAASPISAEELELFCGLVDRVAETNSCCIIGNDSAVINNKELFTSIYELLICTE